MWRKYFQSSKEQRDVVNQLSTEVLAVEAEPKESYSELLPYTTLDGLSEEQKAQLLAQLHEFQESNLDDLVLVPLMRTALVQIKSPSCITQGQCVECKCPIPSKFYESDGCKEGCYKEWPR